ncbi:sodium:calcium antiporter [soil metagenome]
MFAQFSLPALLLLFVGAAGMVWGAGIWISNATDVLTAKLKLGEALGGLIFLAVATNLPEMAITFSAAREGRLGVAVGNLLGGIAIQTVVLALLDALGSRRKQPLTARVGSLSLVIEGVLVIALLSAVVMGVNLPASLIWARVTPGGVLILGLWIAGVWLIGKSRDGLPWKADGRDEPSAASDAPKPEHRWGTRRSVFLLAVGGALTLGGGVLLERAGDAIAGRLGLSGVLFGATALAAATAVPELSTGLASVKKGKDALAISDIFGGNAFLPVLFLLATVVSGKAVLPQADRSDVYLTALAILLTTVYVCGLLFRPKRRVLGMGIDSLVVAVLYVVGIIGLVALAQATSGTR